MKIENLKISARRLSAAAIAALVVATMAEPAYASFPFVAAAKTLIADSAEFLGLYVGLLCVIVGICLGLFRISTGQGDGAKVMVMALFAGVILGGLTQLATYAYGLGGGGGISL
jgi:hypothetical protein